MAFPLGWPPPPASSARNYRFFVSGTTTANFSDNAYLFSQTGGVALAVIGGIDTDGMVLISTVATGVESLGYSVEVILPRTPSESLSASFDVLDDRKIIVSLATTAAAGADDAANTATLVAAAVNGLTGINAVALGAGTSSLRFSEPLKNFLASSGTSPTPSVPYRGGIQQTVVGNRSNPGGHLGGGRNAVFPGQDPYGSPVPMVHPGTILVINDDATATNTLEYSFDGLNVHGEVRGGETLVLRGAHEAGIAVRLTAGTPDFRIIAW